MIRHLSSRTASICLTALLVLEVSALVYLQSPNARFVRFIGFDSGVDLTMQNLMARGYRPTVDFGCVYGVLPLLINRVWYGLAGLTPGAFRAETLVVLYLLAWGLARFARVNRVGAVGIALIALAMPDILFPSTITVVQVLEPALLIFGLAEQARGRRGAALAFATACCFIKPAMGFVYGACLLVFIALAAKGKSWAGGLRMLRPAATVGAVLSVTAIAAFGLGPLLATILPLKGAAAYRAYGTVGFCAGIGSVFRAWPTDGFLGYFRYEVGFWLLGSLWLVVGGIAAAVRLIRRGGSEGEGEEGARDDELVAGCAAMHVVFVTCMYGPPTSWTYYFTILILGLATLGKRGRVHVFVAWGLAALLLVNDRSKLQQSYNEWSKLSPSAETLGLWASPDERAEWREVLARTEGKTPALLAWVDGPVPLLPRFAPPAAAYLFPKLALPIEIHRKAEQLASAEAIVFVALDGWKGFTEWPELARALDGCELDYAGKTFQVYRRLRPPASATGAHTSPVPGGILSQLVTNPR